MINVKIYCQTYLFGFTFFIFFILWRTGKVAVWNSCKFLPQIVKTCSINPLIFLIKECLILTAYLVFTLKNISIKSRLIDFNDLHLSSWISLKRFGNGDQNAQTERERWSFQSFLLFIYKQTALFSEKKFYKEIHDRTRMEVYKRMPWRLLSRQWGSLNRLKLPVLLREPIYHLYVWMFACRLEEAVVQNLRNYKNLSEFFRRLIKPELRPIHRKACLTSPVDGTILYCGRVKGNLLEQVKGVTYSLQEFLGPFEAHRFHVSPGRCRKDESDENDVITRKDNTEDLCSAADDLKDEEDDDGKRAINLNFPKSRIANEDVEEQVYEASDPVKHHREGNFEERLERLPSKCFSMTHMKTECPSSSFSSQSCLQRIGTESSHLLEDPANNSLFYCVIYLAPGDYHRFHSPVDWSVQYRRHFPGELFSVKPSVAHWLKGLFNMNERVLYLGRWRTGFFSMTAVGATNVGSISVYIDKKLKTNTRQRINQGRFFDKSFIEESKERLTKTSPGVDGKNDEIGDLKSEAGVYMKKGKLFGEFNLGSTIVLLFEAPKNLKFKVKPEAKVKYGEALI